jgi:hypothetical protein
VVSGIRKSVTGGCGLSTSAAGTENTAAVTINQPAIRTSRTSTPRRSSRASSSPAARCAGAEPYGVPPAIPIVTRSGYGNQVNPEPYLRYPYA